MKTLDQIALNLLKDAVDKGNIREHSSINQTYKFHIPNQEILKILSDYLKENDYINQAEAVDWLIETKRGPRVDNSSQKDAFWRGYSERIVEPYNTFYLPKNINIIEGKCVPHAHSNGAIYAFLFLLENWNA